MARVSILMAAYNSEAYIGQAIDSIVQQTFADWELIIIDDGSRDKTFDLMEKWCRRDCRIRIHRHLLNQGVGAVRRQSLELASAPYVAVLDSDDVAERDWLARRIAALDARRGIVAVSGARVLIDCGGSRIGFHAESDAPDIVRWRLLFGNPITHSASVFRLQAAKDAGGYGASNFAEDWALFQRLARRGDILLDNHASVQYRIHSATLTRSYTRHKMERVVALWMSEQCEHELGMSCPAELAWYLFRERRPFAGIKPVANAAVQFVLKAASRFAQTHTTVRSSERMARAIIADIANVRRCAPNGIGQVAADARAAWDLIRPRTVDLSLATALAKLAFAPVRAYQARAIARRES